MRKSQFAWFSVWTVIEDGPGSLDFLGALRISCDDAINDPSIIVGEIAVDLPVIHERQKFDARIDVFGALLHLADVSRRVKSMIFVEIVDDPGCQVCVFERQAGYFVGPTLVIESERLGVNITVSRRAFRWRDQIGPNFNMCLS